ncbi:TPA: hypothetical protein ACGQQ7_000632 [Streptococcus agalactiae]|jgi:hypothetical protein|nr:MULTISPECIES: hypothetical protein [Streptococcus]MEE3707167.1 hypothetical protein [Streptococcus sp. R3]EPT95230.1 hypothetical protein SAG0102_11295 [Streptococcus agalactiae BSU188]EPW30667.1 hypothetical protein SAG0069_04740 [Streptococcus agalactiae CCUG 44074]EPW72030.1 hypothetical protein SAG0101_02725 [Streptococcus agalactiae BSU451]EPX14671.1 hypothetical protein SAG0192_05910 [Streptococcus agalactiae str. Gottschalk 1002A]
MRPNKYPYVKSQWDKKVNTVYKDGKPYATLVTYINRLTGKAKP